MSSNYGDKVKIQIFGQSHSEALGVVIDGLEAGIKIDLDKINTFLARRQGGNNSYSTKRKEADVPHIISGLVDGYTCGAPLCALFENSNTRSGDYDNLRVVPRPSHADYCAKIKYSSFNDVRGGGHFSGRLTLPLCFAGAVCMQVLEKKGINIFAHIGSIGGIFDTPYDLVNVSERGYEVGEFPVISKEAGEMMIKYINDCRMDCDSVGGIIECAAVGVGVGLGDPMFDGVENKISAAVFGIPAIKGIEFGLGFGVAQRKGSENNDSYYFDGDKVKTKTNNQGGISGGISNGMPIVFRVAVKPTPSIAKEQESVDLEKGENTILQIKGRHDPCIVPRAVPCVEAACALALINLID